MIVNPLDDVMSYFEFAFFAYIVLFIILCLNFLKTLYVRKNLSSGSPVAKLIIISDLAIDILCGAAMAGGLIFQGVLADNNALEHNTWFMALLFLSIAGFIIFVLNVAVALRERK